MEAEQEYEAPEENYADEAAGNGGYEQAAPEPEPEPQPEPEAKQPEPPQQNYSYDEPQGADFSADKTNIKAYCDNLYSDNPSFNWFSTKLVDEKLKTPDLAVDASGRGGLPELVAYLKQQASEIVFFELRVNTYDDEQSQRAKFIYGRFVGSGVKFMLKAKLTPNLGTIADNFQVKHISKDLDEKLDKFDATNLSKEFLRIGGAHKPSRYDYGGGEVYQV